MNLAPAIILDTSIAVKYAIFVLRDANKYDEYENSNNCCQPLCDTVAVSLAVAAWAAFRPSIQSMFIR
ncbi:MAG: hypothetical protein JO002_07775 [Burkholderiaceae bacterium]|nr:hypothetical protein [Burkholderiaceae bacterium]